MSLFTTPTQFLVLGLVLVAGWVFGLASHPGGKKWRDRYAAERDAHAASRRAAEQQRAADSARVAELERENARLARTTPVAATAPTAPTASGASPAARPAYSAGDRRGWFDWGTRPARP